MKMALQAGTTGGLICYNPVRAQCGDNTTSLSPLLHNPRVLRCPGISPFRETQLLQAMCGGFAVFDSLVSGNQPDGNPKVVVDGTNADQRRRFERSAGERPDDHRDDREMGDP